MGVIKTILYEKLIDPIPDRNCNRIRVHKAPNGEITIHFRNLKIVLHDDMEIVEWKEGFKTAMENLDDDYLRNDI